jgi:L-threonylcarbamoyladenylate synthase
LSCDASNQTAIEKLYRIKRRPLDKKLPVFFQDIEHVQEHCHLSSKALELGKKFWPGPITLILELRNNSIMRKIHDTTSLAVRIPNSPHVIELIRLTNTPLIGTSANISGTENPLCYEEVQKQFKDERISYFKIDYKLSGVQSTILSFMGNKIEVLREGAISI